jgi:hypothetical protein
MTPIQALELVRGFAKAVQESTPEAQREVVQRVFQRIAITDDRVTDVDVYPVYAEALRCMGGHELCAVPATNIDQPRQVSSSNCSTTSLSVGCDAVADQPVISVVAVIAPHAVAVAADVDDRRSMK